jgi:hypothetical protein
MDIEIAYIRKKHVLDDLLVDPEETELEMNENDF